MGAVLLLERNEDEPGCVEARAEHRNAGCVERWESPPFTPNLVPFGGENVNLKEEQADRQPLDYYQFPSTTDTVQSDRLDGDRRSTAVFRAWNKQCMQVSCILV